MYEVVVLRRDFVGSIQRQRGHNARNEQRRGSGEEQRESRVRQQRQRADDGAAGARVPSLIDDPPLIPGEFG